MNEEIQQRAFNNSKKYGIEAKKRSFIFWIILAVICIIVICLIICIIHRMGTSGVLLAGTGTDYTDLPGRPLSGAEFSRPQKSNFQSGDYMGHMTNASYTSAANWGNGSRIALANQELSQIGNGENMNASFLGQNLPFGMAPNDPSWGPNLLNPLYNAYSTAQALQSVPEAEFYDNMNGQGYIDMITPQFNARNARRPSYF